MLNNKHVKAIMCLAARYWFQFPNFITCFVRNSSHTAYDYHTETLFSWASGL